MFPAMLSTLFVLAVNAESDPPILTEVISPLLVMTPDRASLPPFTSPAIFTAPIVASFFLVKMLPLREPLLPINEPPIVTLPSLSPALTIPASLPTPPRTLPLMVTLPIDPSAWTLPAREAEPPDKEPPMLTLTMSPPASTVLELMALAEPVPPITSPLITNAPIFPVALM